ncbi:putative repeat protein (TIGR04042 family) [Streptomyces sp. SAI-135]|uniref:MSMEG_0570 family nitrogen starvation response protein n=1 Tax=unclassified Streptomyces TaxID=2593676 RepID=UPI002474DAF6|nr:MULTISPECIES: MSMEG_0570 family nitrogen starvation response protein [unclassified Streptomyces]MDH6513875.1 putative repeat protein (TIGR04042 family) [Streptomyces sp. SAI-090]MDH6622043.1 putative repeat protein (TIGR04042 family) [Streptomyces sp. SAI-135]
MPEMYFHVRWPDGTTQRCYSPSTVVEDYFVPGSQYPLADFLERSRTALGIAGERVQEKFGFFCTGASDQLAQIERTAAAYATVSDAEVTVESLTGADGSAR